MRPVTSFGLVYEYIMGQAQDLKVTEDHLVFFQAVGFGVNPFKVETWHDGRLIKLCEVCSVLDREWKSTSLYNRDATDICSRRVKVKLWWSSMECTIITTITTAMPDPGRNRGRRKLYKPATKFGDS
jgi:hypothetical protein